MKAITGVLLTDDALKLLNHEIAQMPHGQATQVISLLNLCPRGEWVTKEYADKIEESNERQAEIIENMKDRIK